MRKTLFSLLVALLTLSPVAASDWTSVAKMLEKSSVYVESSEGSCTGFVINSKTGDGDRTNKDNILTAAHCDVSDPKIPLYADNESVEVLHKDTKKDLMVLRVSDTGRPALKLAKENPSVGTQIVAYGYGWGLEQALMRMSLVSADNIYIPEDGIGGPFIAVDSQFVPGMSGGPVVNGAGEVVLIVQRGGGGVGIGVGAEIIKAKVGKYFEKDEVKKP